MAKQEELRTCRGVCIAIVVSSVTIELILLIRRR
jgi:hypothetical protein